MRPPSFMTSVMKTVWQEPVNKKLAISALLFGIMLATASQQTAEVATAYLLKRGYTDVSVGAPAPYCGRGPMLFPFTGRSKTGEPVSGELSLGNFAYLYRITLRSP